MVWLADANTAPTDADYNARAFDQVRHRRADAELKSGGSVDHPGCSKVERDSYKSVCDSFDGVNVWESLNPGKRGGSAHYTWSAGEDKYASRGIGQRIDHVVCSKSCIDEFESIEVFQGLGSSDHWPLCFKMRAPGAKVAAVRAIRSEPQRGAWKELIL